MPKIKNWSKVDDDEWKHDDKNLEVFIGTEGSGYRPIYVEHYIERGRKEVDPMFHDCEGLNEEVDE